MLPAHPDKSAAITVSFHSNIAAENFRYALVHSEILYNLRHSHALINFYQNSGLSKNLVKPWAIGNMI